MIILHNKFIIFNALHLSGCSFMLNECMTLRQVIVSIGSEDMQFQHSGSIPTLQFTNVYYSTADVMFLGDWNRYYYWYSNYQYFLLHYSPYKPYYIFGRNTDKIQVNLLACSYYYYSDKISCCCKHLEVRSIIHCIIYESFVDIPQ